MDVRRISVIPDERGVIGTEAAAFSEKYDYVFTSGGVGPTHDDVTMAGIAEGFGVELVRNDEIHHILRLRYRKPLNDAILKMTEVPQGAEIIFSEGMRFPVVFFRNIFIFPGIPEYLKNKFSMIRERFRSSTFHLKRLYLNSHESSLAAILNMVVAGHADVTFGSYPVLGKPDYRVIITAESRSGESLDRALNELLDRLPGDVVTRIE